jgi:putative holin Dp-1
MSPLSPTPRNMLLMSDKMYNILKHAAAIGFPALSALYFTIAQIWSIPDTKEVMGTIAAINTFIGALVGVSYVKYNNSGIKYVGSLEVTETGDRKTYSLNFNADPETIDQMSEVTFKVNPSPSISASTSSLGNPPQLGV